MVPDKRAASLIPVALQLLRRRQSLKVAVRRSESPQELAALLMHEIKLSFQTPHNMYCSAYVHWHALIRTVLAQFVTISPNHWQCTHALLYSLSSACSFR